MFSKIDGCHFCDIVTFPPVIGINLNSTEREFEPCWWVHFWRNWNCSLEILIKYMTQIKDMILRTLDYEWLIVEYHVLTKLELIIIEAISCLNEFNHFHQNNCLAFLSIQVGIRVLITVFWKTETIKEIG